MQYHTQHESKCNLNKYICNVFFLCIPHVRYDLYRDFIARHRFLFIYSIWYVCGQKLDWNRQLTQLKDPIFTYSVFIRIVILQHSVFRLFLGYFLFTACISYVKLCTVLWTNFRYTMLSQNQTRTRAAMTNNDAFRNASISL